MQILISYLEISNWIYKHFRIASSFKCMDEKTLEVNCKPGRFIPTVRMAFKVESVQKNVICMSYDCSMPVSLIIVGAVCNLQNRFLNGIEIKPEKKLINVYLERIEKLQKALECVVPTGFSFGEEKACMTFTLLLR